MLNLAKEKFPLRGLLFVSNQNILIELILLDELN